MGNIWVGLLLVVGCSGQARSPDADADTDTDGDADADTDADADGDADSDSDRLSGLLIYSDVGEAADLPAPVFVEAPLTTPWDSFAFGDLDADGTIDVVVGTDLGVGVLLDVLGEARVLPFAYPTPWIPEIARLAHLDDDGHLDLVLAGWGNRLSVFRGRGDGTFDTPVEVLEAEDLGSINQLTDVEVVDVDADGSLDLVACGDEEIDIRVFLGDGALGFELSSAVESASVNARHQSVSVADLNHDGFLDVFSLVDLTGYRVGDPHDSWLAVHLGDGAGGLGPEQRNELVGMVSPSGTEGTPADLDGDGNVDLLWFAEDKGETLHTIDVTWGNPDGTFTAAEVLLETDTRWDGYWIVDVTGDGIPDVVGGDLEFVRVLDGEGGGELAEPRVARIPGRGRAFTIADADGSGIPDLIFSAIQDGPLDE